MTTIALTYTRVQKKVQTSIDSIRLPIVNWRAVCFIGFFICLSLLVFYVIQINSLTKSSYTLNTYQSQISKLSQENKNLAVSFAESSFLGQALDKIQSLNFQRATSVKYIQILDSSAQVPPKNNNI